MQSEFSYESSAITAIGNSIKQRLKIIGHRDGNYRVTNSLKGLNLADMILKQKLIDLLVITRLSTEWIVRRIKRWLIGVTEDGCKTKECYS